MQSRHQKMKFLKSKEKCTRQQRGASATWWDARAKAEDLRRLAVSKQNNTNAVGTVPEAGVSPG
jgi:hypothetical protein